MNKENVKDLNEILGVANTMLEEEAKSEINDVSTAVYNGAGDLESDYKLTRTTLHNLIDTGNTALMHMLELASESNHPRTFEVTATLIKTIADVSRDLLSMQKDMKDLMRPQDSDSGRNPKDGETTYEISITDLLTHLQKEDNE